jgi:hypothetical protein
MSEATSNLTLSLEALLNTAWNYEEYPTYYDTGACLQANITLSNRVNLQGGCWPAMHCPASASPGASSGAANAPVISHVQTTSTTARCR